MYPDCEIQRPSRLNNTPPLAVADAARPLPGINVGHIARCLPSLRYGKEGTVLVSRPNVIYHTDALRPADSAWG